MSNYIFKGPKGSNREHIAMMQAKKMLCIRSGDDNCDCESCKCQIEYHPDCMIVEPDGTSIKKEQIDEILKFVVTAAQISDEKVVMIKDAQKMGTSAANALLKVLEEGPGRFIFTTSESLIDTVASRCVSVSVSDLYTDTETFGLNRTAFFAATELKCGVVEEFKERDFFKKLIEICDLFTNITDKVEILKFFHVYKEKDDKDFYAISSVNEYVATLKLLSGIFFGAVLMGEYKCLKDYGNVLRLYTREQCIFLSELCEKHIYLSKRTGYTKNDFFSFVKEFVKED